MKALEIGLILAALAVVVTMVLFAVGGQTEEGRRRS